MKKNKDLSSASPAERSYFDQVHTWGRLWSVGALLMLLSVPTLICLHLGVWPPAKQVFQALLHVVPLYWGTAVIEVLTYTPMLGAGGTYQSFVTGNITNLKLPCGLNAMENAKVKANSEEGEVISTIAIGVSAITTTVIIAAGVLLFSPLLSKITQKGSAFEPAFTYILPALFGALGAGYFRKHWKISIFPILMGVVVLLFSPALPVGTLLFITIVAAIGGALLMLKLKWI